MPSYVPTSGLVAYYSFSGSANDESGNGNNGTVNGATLTTDRNGATNNAYSFDGINNFIEVADNSSLDLSNQFSLGGWINSNLSAFNNQAILGKGRATNLSGYHLTYRSSLNDMAVMGLNDGITNTGVATTDLIDINNWHYILGTYDGIIMRIYVDGVLKSSQTTTISLLNSTESLNIGRETVGLGNYFSGKLDEIGIWNRALTQQEITAIYNNCPPVSSTINTTSPLTFCTGASAILNATKTGTPYTLQWQLNTTNISSATLTSYTATQTGSYTLITDSLGCKGTSAPVNIIVNTLPSVSINNIGAYTSYNAPAIILSGNPTGGTFSGAGVSVSTFTASTAGLGTKNITYSFTDANSCSNSASTQTIVYDTLGVVCTSYTTITTYVSVTDTLYIDVNLTGIPTPNNINKVKVYPNPANDHITIDLGNYASMSGYTVKIKNNLGQEVYSAPVTQQTEYIDLNGWSGNGMYFMHVIDASNNTLEIKKIVLQ